MVDNTAGLKVKCYIAHTANPAARRSIPATIDVSCPYAPSMTIFSSRGPNPTAADIIKPDITAPGLQILAGNTPFPTPGPSRAGRVVPGHRRHLDVQPGDGRVYALIKQAAPGLERGSGRSRPS